MPPPNTVAPPQKKHDLVSPAPVRSELPTVLFGPFAAAFSLPSEKGMESLQVIDTGPTFEEQQRRIQTVSVIRDWEISAWYSVAGRESIPQTRLRFMKRLIRPNKVLVEDEDWADVYDGEELKKVAEGPSKEPQVANTQEQRGSGNRKRK